MYRTQKWIAAHDGRALAEAVAAYFPDVPPATLAASYQEYLRLGLWNAGPLQSREGLSWLADAAVAAGRLQRKFAYEEVVDMQFAEQALLEEPAAL
jgi:ABC-type nitrate/sulfonate/bicarbonate transport system substrate-binding protein